MVTKCSSATSSKTRCSSRGKSTANSRKVSRRKRPFTLENPITSSSASRTLPMYFTSTVSATPASPSNAVEHKIRLSTTLLETTINSTWGYYPLSSTWRCVELGMTVTKPPTSWAKSAQHCLSVHRDLLSLLVSTCVVQVGAYPPSSSNASFIPNVDTPSSMTAAVRTKKSRRTSTHS